MANYDDYDDSLTFEGDFQGEPIISKARIHGNGDIHIHQGPKTGEGKFRPDDIVGLGLDELKQVVNKAEELIEGVDSGSTEGSLPVAGYEGQDPDVVRWKLPNSIGDKWHYSEDTDYGKELARDSIQFLWTAESIEKAVVDLQNEIAREHDLNIDEGGMLDEFASKLMEHFSGKDHDKETENGDME
ncbi:hypothetical protein ACM16X_02390 [Haloarcula japonica]|uniref:hypothetical protein n=1 Tax=Haloarcula japonica TaxID=29282 RepID=UPI0039F6E74E